MTTSFHEGTSAEAHPHADTPVTVAAQTLHDYARRRTASYPGRAMNRVLTWPARLLPRTTSARVAGSYNRRQRMHEVVDLG